MPPYSAAQIQPIVDQLPAEPLADRRFVVAIAGPPAAGKTTLAASLAAQSSRAALLGLDAFHFDDAILRARSHLDRKGAPHTFDLANYELVLTALRSNRRLEMSVPRFDRELELTRNCADLVTPQHDIVITEGNYLLIDEPPWQRLRPLFDLTVWVDADLETVERRILQRWDRHGLSGVHAAQKATQNDLPNAHLCVDRSVPAQLTVTTSSQ